MHGIKGLLIPLTFLLLVWTTQAMSDNTDTDIENIFARALLDGNWAQAVDSATELLKEKDNPAINAALAYSLFRTGRKMKAIERLEGRSEHISLLTMAAIEGSSGVRLPFVGKPARGVAVIFVEHRPKGGASLGVVSKVVEIKALKQAFYELIKEPSTEEIRLFREKVLPHVPDYVLTGETIHKTEDGVIYMMFVDTGRLKEKVDSRTEKKGLRIGIITHRGSDRYREDFIRELATHGYRVEDLGRGEFYKIEDRLKAVDVVVELVEDVKTGEQVLGGNFKEFDGGVEMTIYSVHPFKPLAHLGDRTRIVHVDDAIGKKTAIKNSYAKLLDRFHATIDSVKKRLSEHGGAEPPLKVEVSFDKVFSSNYKYYANYPAGTIILKNTTANPLGDVTISIAVKKYIDYPTRLTVGKLPPGKTIKRALNIVFNSRILDITDNTFIQSEIKVTYMDRGKRGVVTLNSPIYVYEKHALLWDDKGKIASFITPRDPVVVDIATDAVAGYSDRGLGRNLVKAGALFEAMGVLGISYMEDPNSPFSVVSGLKGVVDFVQFPRETIVRKVGDCDDLTGLYSSLLEAVGIRTAIVDVPGHVFVMFDTGVSEKESIYFGFPEESYVPYGGTIWIPVETTVVGASFTEAWKKGVENYRRLHEKPRIIEFEKARALYLAPNLPARTSVVRLDRGAIEKRLTRQLERFRKKRLQHVRKELEGLGTPGLVRLIRFYAMEEMLDEALKVARSIPGLDRKPALLNNMANIYYLKRRYERAIKYYRMAHNLDKEDGNILVNIARAYLRLGNRKMAKYYFMKAVEIDGKLKDRYITLYTDINN